MALFKRLMPPNPTVTFLNFKLCTGITTGTTEMIYHNCLSFADFKQWKWQLIMHYILIITSKVKFVLKRVDLYLLLLLICYHEGRSRRKYHFFKTMINWRELIFRMQSAVQWPNPALGEGRVTNGPTGGKGLWNHPGVSDEQLTKINIQFQRRLNVNMLIIRRGMTDYFRGVSLLTLSRPYFLCSEYGWN